MLNVITASLLIYGQSHLVQMRSLILELSDEETDRLMYPDQCVPDLLHPGRGTVWFDLAKDPARQDRAYEITRDGSKEIPALLRLLGSTEKTHVRRYLTGEVKALYDPRWRTGSFTRGYVGTAYWLPPFPGFPEFQWYDLTVGDVAYAVLGQICNRWYTPTFATVMAGYASPSRQPWLVERLLTDWRSITSSELDDVYKSDLMSPDSESRESQAVRRIAVYDPEEYESVMLRKLRDVQLNGTRYKLGDRPRDPYYGFLNAALDLKSPKVDARCKLILADMVRDQGPNVLDEQLGRQLLNRLKRIDSDRALCDAFAKKMIERGWDSNGHYREFLSGRQCFRAKS
jgi:hypothetical protein